MAAIQDIQETIANAFDGLWQLPGVRLFVIAFLLGPPVVLLVGWGVHRVLHAITTSRPTRAQRLTVHIALLCIGVGFILPLVWDDLHQPQTTRPDAGTDAVVHPCPVVHADRRQDGARQTATDAHRAARGRARG